MAISKPQLDDIFIQTRGRNANEDEYKKFKDRDYEGIFTELDKAFSDNTGFINDLFIKYRGRPANANEIALYKDVPPSRLVGDLTNDTKNIQTDPFNDYGGFEEFEQEQRPLIEQEYGPYYDELIADLEEDVQRRKDQYGEDNETALARALEDKDNILEQLATKESQLQEDVQTGRRALDRQGRLMSQDFQTTMDEINKSRSYLQQDKKSDLSSLEQIFNQEKVAETENLNQRGLLTGSAFQDQPNAQGGVAGNIQQQNSSNRMERLNKVKQAYGRQGEQLGQQEEKLRTGLQRGQEQLGIQRKDLDTQLNRGLESIGTQREQAGTGYDRTIEDLNKADERGAIDLDDYLDDKRKEIEQQKEVAIGTAINDRYKYTTYN